MTVTHNILLHPFGWWDGHPIYRNGKKDPCRNFGEPPLTTSGPEKGATLGIERLSIWQVPRQQTNRMRTRTRLHLLLLERQSFGKEPRLKQPYGNMTYHSFFISVVPRSLPFNYATIACEPESAARCLSQTPPMAFVFRHDTAHEAQSPHGNVIPSFSSFLYIESEYITCSMSFLLCCCCRCLGRCS